MASNIRYLSTRGESTGASYDEIVLRGLASDGGLFMPESYPQVTAETLESCGSSRTRSSPLKCCGFSRAGSMRRR